jgi:hypothetical protein
MSLFRKQEPAAETAPPGAMDLVRAALRAKGRKVNLSSMARDLGMQTSVLEDLAESRIKTLAPDLLQKVVGYIWSNGTTIDIERDVLVTGNKLPPPMKVGPMSPPWPKGPRQETGASQGLSEPLPSGLGLMKPLGRRPGWSD